MSADRERPDPSRRLWLRGAALVGAALTSALARQAAGAEMEPIVQPERSDDNAFMRRALVLRQRAEADGDQPYGAVVVRDGRIVGEAASAVVTRGDPTAHAEMEAIRDAARRLNRRDLVGCILYSSSRPCPMCEAAASWAGVERMIHGASLTDAGRPRLRAC